MNSTIFLGALIGSIVGAVVGHVKFRRALAGAVCLACCGALMAYVLAPGPRKAQAVETPQQFQEALLADRVVLADFYADWCPPCRKLAPTIAELAREYSGRAAVLKINVDQARSLAATYGVRSIPMVIIFLDGEPIGAMVGCRPKQQYSQALDAALSAT